MKKVFFVILTSLFLVSCSNVANGEINVIEEKTLKEIIDAKDTKITWAKELEEGRLTADISNDGQKISSGIALTPEVEAVVYDDSEPVYPELPGFGSLDTRAVTGNLKNIISNFCSSLSRNLYNGPQSYFDDHFIFNYVFFKLDLADEWKNRFGVEFPQKDDGKWHPSLFSHWTLGKPLLTGEIMEQPVRFYCKRGFLDVTLYVRLDNNKIYQITINE